MPPGTLGVLVWTFLEYGLHRFLFHMPVNGGSPFLVQTHWVLHGQHHKFPLDKGRLVFPPVAGFGLALPFYALFHLLLSRPAADALMAGALLGYMGYDLTHYYLHHGQPRRDSYFGSLKAYHRDHHYKDPDHGRWGVGQAAVLEKAALWTRMLIRAVGCVYCSSPTPLAGYGISSKLWDFPFRTMPPPRQK